MKSEIKAGFPSIQIAVIKNSKLEFAKSYGSSTDETMYDIASNTKMYATNYANTNVKTEINLKYTW